ncbi:hypothetical protein GE061_009728 [Apolygus lucorum]|uniref:Transglutaminase-like domain-containing protein n=1 Tax=Apolygus lucorum TaxID=248454 RepID=A0A8S9Y114_APOLU|nr:hypothetical protein GE061_009728 [Apolygus lucorum]
MKNSTSTDDQSENVSKQLSVDMVASSSKSHSVSIIPKDNQASQITMTVTKEISKVVLLKFPSLAAPPDVDQLDTDILGGSIPSSAFRPKERRNVRIRYYRCFRDGHFYAKGKGLRHLKMKGSVKIDSVCPAMIKAEEDKATGVIRVSYIHTHVGHLQELGRLNLSKSERAEIAQKVAMGIPYGTILDTIRESVKNQDVGRLHLTTRKDIWNVQSSFGLMGTEKGFIHGSDRTSVEVWVAQMQKQSEIVRFYKPQGACMPEEPDLHENDMVLIIATDAQIEMLLNCMHAPIEARVLMSDMSEVYANGWSNVMPPPKRILWCAWHVDHAWRKNLNKISDISKRSEIYKVIKTLMVETDEVAFLQMFTNAVQAMENDPVTKNFETEPQAAPLAVKRINRLRSLNAQVHNSFYYDAMGPKSGQTLVLRRGHPLHLQLSLNRPVGDDDHIFLEFKLLDVEPSVFADGSFVRVKIERATLSQPNNDYKWVAVCHSISDSGNTLNLQVRLADKTPLGHWSMRILATSANYQLLTPFKPQIYIIANPWGKDFMGSPDGLETKRIEYVMADAGLVFAGCLETPISVPWRFGQFDKKILETAISLLKGIPAIYRSHLFKIVHHLSYLLHDTKGIVQEKKKPAEPWAGSAKILLKFAGSKKPVDGSRCNYVAPCVFVTICRALGIPARPVTFYNVLPENDGGIAVDRYYHHLGLILDNLNEINMWSYKVMPEVMLSRPDLPRPFSSSGWQCVSQFGPCAVATIRAGAVYRNKPYGSEFIYRMLRAQYVFLKVEDSCKPIKVVPSRTIMMCSLIVTKAVGSWITENLTACYSESKYPYRTPQIRDYSTAIDATHFEVAVPINYDGGYKKSHTWKSRNRTNTGSSPFTDVSKPAPSGVPLIDTLRENINSVSGFYYDEELDTVMAELVTNSNWWGEPVTAALIAKSRLKSDVTALFSLEICKVTETGQLQETVTTNQCRIVLKPEIEEIFKTKIYFDEYSNILVPGDTLRVNGNIHVEEEDHDHYFEKFIGFMPLHVEINITNTTTNNCDVFLSNNSDSIMKKCNLTIGEVDCNSVVNLFSGLILDPGTGVHANIDFTPKNPSGVYFVEVRATCGEKKGFTTAFAALSFNVKPTLIPNLPSKTFAPM